MPLLALLLLCALVAALILPWVNHARLLSRKREIQALEAEVASLRATLRRSEEGRSPEAHPLSTLSTPERSVPGRIPEAAAGPLRMDKPDAPAEAGGNTAPHSKPVVTPPPIPKAVDSPVATSAPAERGPAVAATARTSAAVRADAASDDAAKSHRASEAAPPVEPEDWFGKVAVWVGGVALLMAGFFMVKYSIESGWITPAVRVGLTALFGLLLCISGTFISWKSVQEANARIGQALTGAGVACLYFAAYASVHLYAFLTLGQGFVAMVAVTVLAVLLSLKNGAPIALMGLVGGFFTPLLMGTADADTARLFTYLFLLYGGAQFLCLKRGWWGLLLVSLVAAYLWSTFLLIGWSSGAMDSVDGVMLFILGICGLNAVWMLLWKTDPGASEATRMVMGLLRGLAWGGGLLQALAVIWLSGFQAVDMTLFAILSIGALALAVVRDREFFWAAVAAYGMVAMAGLANPEPSMMAYFSWPVGLALIYFLVGHFAAYRSERQEAWRALALGVIISLVPILYFNREVTHAAGVPFSWFWLTSSLVAAALILVSAEHMRRLGRPARRVVGDFSAFACFLIGFGIWADLPDAYLSLGFAALLLVAAVYWKQRLLARAGWVVGVLAVGWIISMAERGFRAADYLFEAGAFGTLRFDGVDVFSWAAGFVVLSLCAILLAGRIRRRHRHQLGGVAGVAGLFLLVAGYGYAEIHWLAERATEAALLGWLTAILAVGGLIGVLVSPQWRVGAKIGWILFGLAGYRIVVLHLLGSIGPDSRFFWNGLLPQFGVPFFTSWVAAYLLHQREGDASAKIFQVATMALGFVWATFLIRNYFGGEQLLGRISGSTEMYTYSVVWLLLAVAYQAVGLLRQIRSLHVGSLCLLLLTVGKVFLIDAAELEGLYRVVSFLGLGFVLIGIGYFYNKVVFRRSSEAASVVD